MNSRNVFKKPAILLLVAALVLQTASCGFFLYPERRNQSKGEVDVGVAALDAIGLVFFIVPGLIAFAVDFSANTIYLPSGKQKAGRSPGDAYTAVRVSAAEMNKAGIETIIQRHTGMDVDLYSRNVQTYRLETIDQARDIQAGHS